MHLKECSERIDEQTKRLKATVKIKRVQFSIWDKTQIKQNTFENRLNSFGKKSNNTNNIKH